MKFFRVLCALALVVGFATVASAEVQNVKVSGDLSMYAFWRSQYDLDSDNVCGSTFASGNDDANWFMSIAEIQVDADLTDNVATCIRISNERDWEDPTYGGNDSAQYDIDVDLAYVTLKEMLYSPLTLTIGRQDIWLGDGMILGAKLLDYNNSIIADEYTTYIAFDAIRATLDYDPWTIDLAYSKIEEGTDSLNYGANNNDDADLYLANVGYIFDSYNAEAEAYFIGYHDRTHFGEGDTKASETDTVGARGSFDPLEDLTLKGEVAYQFGDFAYDGANICRDRSAWLFNVSGEYRWPEARWTPKVGLEYLYLSGERDDTSTDSGDWEGWNPLFFGKQMLAIRQYHNSFYDTAYRGATNMDNYPNNADQDSGMSNSQYVLVSGSVAPTEDLTLDAVYAHCWLAEKVTEANSNTNVGDELDVTLTYDYTEDVTFGLLAAWFFPGDYFPSEQDDMATDIVGSMKVSF